MMMMIMIMMMMMMMMMLMVMVSKKCENSRAFLKILQTIQLTRAMTEPHKKSVERNSSKKTTNSLEEFASHAFCRCVLLMGNSRYFCVMHNLQFENLSSKLNINLTNDVKRA